MMKKNVRILLVGAPGVGKTSLIMSLVSEEFPDLVPAKAEEITIPADVTPEKVPTHIVDYSGREQEEGTVVEEILKAHVVCIVYSVEDESTIEKMTSYWLPLLRRVIPEEHRKPVILVGNKSDLLEISSMESILPIMNEYAEVETCVECSAKTLKNISEVFYYAQKAVLHPTAPLYIPDEKELTPKCKQALCRIFKICDNDTDGILNDKEIYKFQRRCFNVPLQPQALEDVKAVVRKHISDGVVRDGITQRGFLFLHTLFIQRGRHETTWTVLRKFGYDDNLQLCREYLRPQIKIPPECSTELSHYGYQFFSNLFHKYDEDRDGCLSPTELQNLFNTCPLMPWGPDVNNTVLTNAQGWITLQGFLAQWTFTTLLDLPRTLEYLAYLGYMYEHDSQSNAIHVTRDKTTDLKKRQTHRTVLQAHVIGPRGVGKTALLQGLLGRNIQYVSTLNREHLSNYAINLVQVYGQEKYVLLHEIDSGMAEGFMTPLDLACDVVCLLYDVTNPVSFDYITRIYRRYFIDSKIPVMVLACHAEGKEVIQDCEFQPVQFCNKMRIPPPLMVSCFDKISKDVYAKIATMAAFPHLKNVNEEDPFKWLKIGIGVAVVASVGFGIYKFIMQNRTPQAPRVRYSYRV